MEFGVAEKQTRQGGAPWLLPLSTALVATAVVNRRVHACASPYLIGCFARSSLSSLKRTSVADHVAHRPGFAAS